jgi:hypothetical protein
MLCGDGWGFIHIPKCGGASIRDVLESKLECEEVSEVLPMAPYFTVTHKNHWVKREQHSGRVFCFVRHPIAWMRSYWAMRLHEGRRNRRKVLDRLWNYNFNTWVFMVTQQQPGYIGKMYDAYTAYATEIYRLEDGIEPVLTSITDGPVEVAHRHKGKLPNCSAGAVRAIKKSEARIIRKYY